jgi:hypothetical protein
VALTIGGNSNAQGEFHFLRIRQVANAVDLRVVQGRGRTPKTAAGAQKLAR